MFNSLPLLLFAALLTFTSCKTQAQDDQVIVFYNVENLFDTLDTPDKDDAEYLPTAASEWNTEKYNTKIAHINQVLEKVGKPLLVGMCEIENEAVVRDVVKGGKLNNTHGVVHFESTDERGIDNALIYDSSILTLEDKGFIRFALPGNSRPTRDILWAKFSQGNDRILAMVNHWPSRSGGQVESEPKRLVAATTAKHFIDSVQVADPTLKIVFMGDLNDYPTNLAPQMISSILQPMITKKSGLYGGSYNYKGEWDILDHILISSNFLKKKGVHVVKKSGTIHSYDFNLETYKGAIVPFRTYAGKKYLGGYSDHLPVSVEVD